MATPWSDDQDSPGRESWERSADWWKSGGGDGDTEAWSDSSETPIESAFAEDENWWWDEENGSESDDPSYLPISELGLVLDRIYRFDGGGVVASGIEVFDSHMVNDLTFTFGQYIGYVAPGEAYRPHDDKHVILGDPKQGTLLFRGMPQDKDFMKMEFYFGIVPEKGATYIVPLDE